MKRRDRVILAIDLKSFYASVECIDRGLDPFLTPLVVADESRGDGTIVLAASPFIKKKYGVKSRCRLSTVPKDIEGLIIAVPKMKRYLEMSAVINDIYLRYVSREDLFVYSIDESFLDVTDYLHLKGDDPYSYAKRIVDAIRDETGLTVTCGIGLNLFMAKAAMDIEAKHTKSGIACWNYESIPEKLWNVKPLSDMWGIGSRLEKRLNSLGFYSVGDIAVADKDYLIKEFGVIGEEIYYHSLGYDDAILQEAYTPGNRSISVGQVLLRDFYREEIPSVITDMALEMSDRMFEEKIKATSFDLYLTYKDHSSFKISISFTLPTRSYQDIADSFINRFIDEHKEDEIYRGINLIANFVTSEDNYQLSLFEKTDEKKDELEKLLLNIRKRYGTRKAIPCQMLSYSSTYVERKGQIGGHKA